MYIVPITFTDYDGEKHTENFMFNLNRAEVLQMQVSQKGGLAKHIREIIKEKDFGTLCEMWKEIILKAYGKKSEDGRRFIKSDELSKDFEQTEAFVELFTKLALDARAAAEFVNKIVPEDLAVDLKDVDFDNPKETIKRFEDAETGEVNVIPSLR